MEIELYKLLKNYSELVFFLTLGFGYLIGNIQIFKFKIGSTAGVLLAGLTFGHLGLPPPSALVQSIGFILFIYSVGVEAGPNFLSVFFEDGIRYLTLALVIALSAFALMLLLTSVLKMETGLSAGILAGALTSTPTLAAAQDAVMSGIAKVDAPSAVVVQNIGVAYAITYIFGLIGLLLFIRLIPMLFKVNLQDESRRLAAKHHIVEDDEDVNTKKYPSPIIRAYQVIEGEFTGQPLSHVAFRAKTGCFIQKIKRKDHTFEPTGDTVLEQADRIAVIGPLEGHRKLADFLESPILDEDLLNTRLETTEIVATNKEVLGKNLEEILLENGGQDVFVNGIIRANVELPVDYSLTIARGDLFLVTGTRDRIKAAAKKLGGAERNINETDLLTFSLGIAAGLFIAKITVKIGVVSIGLGMAGGLLISGIAVGSIGSHNPNFGRIPPAARLLLKELGLLFFMATVGLKAGDGIVSAVLSVGPTVFFCGVLITTLPVLIGFFFGYYILKLNLAILMGAITGSMTSTPALNIVTGASKSTIPALGYAGTYTFANVFLALAGALIMIIQ